MREMMTAAAMMVPGLTSCRMTSVAPVQITAICSPTRDPRASAARNFAVVPPASMLSSDMACPRRHRRDSSGSMPIAAMTSELRIALAVSACSTTFFWTAFAAGRRPRISVASAISVSSPAPQSPTVP